MKFSIKHRDTGSVLFEIEADSFVAAVESAVKSRANLTWANLTGADLTRANLTWANLTRAKNISPERFTPLLMLKDQIGPIRAYKLVKANMEGSYNGDIRYEIGGEYTEQSPNTDPQEQCGRGINLATLDWCLKEWCHGYRVLIAEFFAEDIAAIPYGTDGKFRVRRCRIVGEKDISALVAPRTTEALAKESRE